MSFISIDASLPQRDLNWGIRRVRDSVQPTPADLTYIGNRQKTRILDRTARGLDVDGRRFTGYTTNGPYYWYPGPRTRTVNIGGQDRELSRGGLAQMYWFARRYGSSVAWARSAYASIRASAGRTWRRLGRAGTRTNLGIKFANYGAFKWSLGRTTVDLTGPRAPHMLQAIAVKVEALLVKIGIYGPEAARAKGHNEGAGSLPQRKFFGVGVSDGPEIQRDLMSRIMARLGAARTTNA